MFGKVIKGMNVVDQIATSPTGNGGPFPKDVPVDTVTIEHATLIGEETK